MRLCVFIYDQNVIFIVIYIYIYFLSLHLKWLARSIKLFSKALGVLEGGHEALARSLKACVTYNK